MIIWLVGLVVALAFGAVVFIGAPYLPTLRPQTKIAIDLIKLEPGQTLLELGCGDGRVLIAAAERGLRAVGIEINPFLALIAWLRTRRFGGLVKVRWANFWQTKWPESDAVFVFLIPRFMKRLDAKMKQYGGRLVSIAFIIPGKTPIKSENSVFVYEYPSSLRRTGR